MSSRLVAIVAVLVFLISAAYVATRITSSVDTNVLSLLPGDEHDPALADAMRRASEEAANRIVFAIEGGSASERSAAAKALTESLQATAFFRSSSEDAGELWAWLNAHRAGLLCPADRVVLSDGQGAAIAQSALIEWYAPVTAIGRNALATDPLLLTNRLLGCLLPQSVRLTPLDGAEIVSGSLTRSVFRLDVQDQIAQIVEKWAALPAAQGLTLSRAGAVFHAAYGAEQARTEMTFIGGITMVAVLLFYWLMFRSLRAPLIAVCMVVFSLTIGLAGALLIFGSVHVMALVFGAALIGMVVDYTTYFLVTGLQDTERAIEVRQSEIFRPLTLGMVTSVAAFGALLLFPVPAFRQIALFGSVGLISAWVGTLALTPRLEGRSMRAGPGALWAKRVAGDYLARNMSGYQLSGALLICLVVVGLGLLRGETVDDVRRFQVPSSLLASEEAHLRALVGFAPAHGFYLVRGASQDEVTSHEEELVKSLTDKGDAKALSWVASHFDPSEATKREDAQLIKDVLVEPHLGQLIGALGGGDVQAYDKAANSLSGSGPILPDFVSRLRGQTGDTYWSIVPIGGTVSAAVDLPGIELVVPSQRYSDILAQYRWLATLGLLGAVVATGLMLLAFYRRLSSLRILLPTVIALIVSPSVLAMMGMPFTFFSVMGLFLVAGAGVDYAIFQWENPGQAGDWTRVGIVLAAGMTCISVGLLGFSSVLPVKNFGLAVAVGVIVSLLFSPLVRGWSGVKFPGGGA
jgi:predicted exporter